MIDDYPDWIYYPIRTSPPHWTEGFLTAIRDARHAIESSTNDGLTSDIVLGHLAPALHALGYTVETGKRASQRIRRPVLFGDRGAEVVSYEVDAVHDGLGVVVEVEAGRGARGNAIYRDLSSRGELPRRPQPARRDLRERATSAALRRGPPFRILGRRSEVRCDASRRRHRLRGASLLQ